MIVVVKVLTEAVSQKQVENGCTYICGCGCVDPEKIQKLMPAPANQSLQSLQLLQSGPDGASVSSLPISESEDETQGLYHVCLLNDS